MANSKSAAKSFRVSERRRLRNQSYKSATRTLLRKAQQGIEVSTGEETQQAILAAISKLDKAANKGIIHPNNAARKKSRLMARYNKAAGIGKYAQQPEG